MRPCVTNNADPFLLRGSHYNDGMNAPFTPFSANQLATCAPSAAARLALEVVPETGSTNADLMARLAALQRPVCRLAYHQTAGRGRAGRRWITRPGGALTFSVAWRFDRPPHALTGLSLAVGVAIATVLRYSGRDVRLKWPNDLLLDNAKLGGILVESARSASGGGTTWAVIGVGINLALGRDERRRLEQPAADLADLPPDGALPLAGSLLDELVRCCQNFDREGFAPFASRWNVLHAYTGCPVDIIDGERTLHRGTAHGVDASGRFLLETDGGRVALVSGDVSLRARRNEAA